MLLKENFLKGLISKRTTELYETWYDSFRDSCHRPFYLYNAVNASVSGYAHHVIPFPIPVPCSISLVIHDDGRIVVSEYGSYIVSVLSKEGKKLRSFGKGTNNITFSQNFGLAITDDGYILVADYCNHRIQKISMDGQHVASVGSNGTEPLKFNCPTGIAISPVKKRIYITEQSGHRVQVLNSDLTFCRVFGKEGTGNGEFKNPRNIAIDSEGLVYMLLIIIIIVFRSLLMMASTCHSLARKELVLDSLRVHQVLQ